MFEVIIYESHGNIQNLSNLLFDLRFYNTNYTFEVKILYFFNTFCVYEIYPSVPVPVNMYSS